MRQQTIQAQIREQTIIKEKKSKMMMSEDGKKPRVYRVQKTRRSVWKDEEVYKVISVWKKRILELRQTKKNKHIYAEIAEELNEMGMDTICEEVHTKIQNLSQLYRYVM